MSFRIDYINYSTSILNYQILTTCKKFRNINIKNELIYNDYIPNNELKYII